MTALTLTDDKQLALIRRTVAKDCNPPEFDLFIHTCRAVRLDPLRRQIYAFVFHKTDPKRRQMTIVTSIAGYRSIAERTGNYRPGASDVALDPALADPLCNPRGISHATATVHKYIHGEWHAITETAYWDEYAPLKELWAPDETGEDRPSGKFVLEPKKDGWKRMPRVMIEKCAEAKALRRAFPDDFANLLGEEEVDKLHALDMTASELANEGEARQRFELIGGRDCLTIDWCNGGPLERVKAGSLGDRALAFIAEHRESPALVTAWADRNAGTLREYWAIDKSGALAVKAALEPARAALLAQPKDGEAA